MIYTESSITENIKADQKLIKQIESRPVCDIQVFIENADRYIQAVRERRLLAITGKVARSGNSMNVKYIECKQVRGTEEFQYLNFNAFFAMLGYKQDRENFTRIFEIYETHYTILHRLQELGFLTEDERRELENLRPQQF